MSGPVRVTLACLMQWSFNTTNNQATNGVIVYDEAANMTNSRSHSWSHPSNVRHYSYLRYRKEEERSRG
ncbi:MAG: hypothetical protein WBF45_11865 [Acidobacteriaceae bacterium]